MQSGYNGTGAFFPSEACKRNITLILENHYKDDFWEYPEFAQKMEIFCKLVDSIHHPYFGVNYTIEDLKKEEGGAVGYAKRLSHGEIEKGLNDYDAIFSELKRVGFDSWISMKMA